MTDPEALADRLLDAQVEYVLAELAGPGFAELVARDVDEVLAVAATLRVRDVVDVDLAKRTGRKLVEKVGGSPMVADLTAALADAIYDLSASEEHHLGDVISREPVEALIATVLGMHTLQDRALDRMTESPLVGTVASRFVTKIVGDFLQENRKRAEKVPGVSSLMSIGLGAASRVRSATDRHLDQFVGDAAGKGAQFAVRRTNSAMREMIREAPVQGAAMELWDLHAGEPISGLREYLSRQELRELVRLVHEIVMTARATPYAGELVDECIDVFFARYGDHDVASLLPELGLDRDDLVEDIRAFAPPIVEAARADGRLAALVRARLEPFFHAPATLAVLSGDAAAPAPPAGPARGRAAPQRQPR